MKLIVPLLLLSLNVWAADSDFCPVPDFAAVMPQVNLPELPPEPELIPVQTQVYKKNKDATFCKRPMEMVDTIVLHHSEGASTDTAQMLNQYHVNRVSYKVDENGRYLRDARGRKIPDPWYMLGYSFVVNSPYPGKALPVPLVTEGRPMDIVGSHAGSSAYAPMDDEQSRLWAEGQVSCGKEGGEFKVDPAMVKDKKIKANVTTIGVVVAGNYSVKSSDNPNGYPRSAPRYPTVKTQDMIARLSCQLQKKYPRMKSIKWHNYYHDTSCPGTIKEYVGQIKTLAKGYGCEFN